MEYRNHKLSRYLFRKDAFSLIEILLVLVILGVLAGLTLPNFSRTFAKLQLREAAKNMVFLMRYAQSRSIIKQRRHLLIFNEQTRTYRIMQASLEDRTEDFGEDKTSQGYEKIKGRFGRGFKIPEGITVEMPSSGVTFFPDGQIEEMRIYLHDERGNYFTISTAAQAGYVMLFDFRLSADNTPDPWPSASSL